MDGWAWAAALALGGGVFAVEGFVDQMQQRPVPQRLLSETLTPERMALEHILATGLDVVREHLRSKHLPRHIYAVRPGFAKLSKWNLEFPNAYLFEVGLQFAHLPRAQWPSRLAEDEQEVCLQHLLTDFDKPIEAVAEWEPMDAYWPDGTHRMFAQWPLPEDMQEQE